MSGIRARRWQVGVALVLGGFRGGEGVVRGCEIAPGVVRSRGRYCGRVVRVDIIMGMIQENKRDSGGVYTGERWFGEDKGTWGKGSSRTNATVTFTKRPVGVPLFRTGAVPLFCPEAVPVFCIDSKSKGCTSS